MLTSLVVFAPGLFLDNHSESENVLQTSQWKASVYAAPCVLSTVFGHAKRAQACYYGSVLSAEETSIHTGVTGQANTLSCGFCPNKLNLLAEQLDGQIVSKITLCF